METNEELRIYYAAKSRTATDSRARSWRWWLSVLWGYPAVVSVLAVVLNTAAPRPAFSSMSSLAQSLGLLIALGLVWSGKRFAAYLALIPAAAYFFLAIGVGYILAFPASCVAVGAVLTVLLALSLPDSQPD
jgi:hypothetical protein